MNFSQSSTRKPVLSLDFDAEDQELDRKKQRVIRNSFENLNFSQIFNSPNNSNTEALKKIQSRLAKNREQLHFPSINDNKIIKTPRQKDTFLSVFPTRGVNFRNNRKNLSFLVNEDLDYSKKHFNRKADSVVVHRNEMIRASNLFKLYR